MQYYLVAPLIMVRKDASAFTYQSPIELEVGSIVIIPVGKKELTGIVIDQTQKPDFATKSISKNLTNQSLPQVLVQLAQWMSEYYATPLPIVLQTILPSGLNKKRRQFVLSSPVAQRAFKKIILNEEQSMALKKIDELGSGTLLLHGVTGSGKTQIYIEAAKHSIAQGASCIVLTPEISLTPQLVAEFANHFKKIIVTHSSMTEAQRHQAWLEVLLSDRPVIVIGPRSALFMPIKKLGLIVIDECHEASYKQEQAPRYSALRVASKLASFHKNTKVILGSATPSVSDYYLATSNNNPLLELTRTATTAAEPLTQVIDCKNRDNFREHRFLSDALLHEIRQALTSKKQSLLFLNRRGTAPTTLCANCGWASVCPVCFVPLTLHADLHILICHICARQQNLPPSCPQCHHPDIVFKGIGTKMVEEAIKKLFPKAEVARFDADNTQLESLTTRYQDVYDAKIDILIGTQLLAKGLDLPNLQTIGVVQADSGMQLPDYQAEERTFQLLYQVAGRVGRGQQPSHIVVQSYRPDNPIVRLALARDYKSFYVEQLAERRKAHFPPFVYLLKLTCAYKTEAGAIRAANQLATHIRQTWPQCTVLGPTPAFYERLGGNYRWQIVVKSKRRADLLEAVKTVPDNWQVDIDPISLL